MELTILMMAAFSLGEPDQGSGGIVYAHSLIRLVGTVNGMEPLLMLMFTPGLFLF